MATMLSPTEAACALFCLSLSLLLYLLRSTKSAHVPLAPAQGYIIDCLVTHGRLLPVDAAHSFTYPLVCLLVSLRALEEKKLELGRGWIFGYGGIWGRLVGLRSAPYLTRNEHAQQPLSEKLEAILNARGYRSNGVSRVLEDVWMLTMPSFLGYEGINPLTVYFCYRASKLWVVVLEIHNTFGEAHVHVLKAGQGEDEASSRPKGFDHQWTFPREFHVSPFNDRLGYYTVSIRPPIHPPTSKDPHDPPRPIVRVHLHTPSPHNPSAPGPLKLAANWRSVVSRPLTSYNLLRSLVHAPFALLITFPRIAFQAWVLHYKKRLDVFIRPAPLPPFADTQPHVGDTGITRGGGVKWLHEGALERYARRKVETFLCRQADEDLLNIKVSLVATDPEFPDLVFHPRTMGDDTPHLVVTYAAPRFFTIMFTCPSAEHALLLGCDTEGIFSVSSRKLFLNAFSPSTSRNIVHQAQEAKGILQRLRAQRVPTSITFPIPTHHPLDTPHASTAARLKSILALRAFFLLEHFERWVFGVTRARFVTGQEPWYMWERASKIFNAEPGEVEAEKEWGSVIRKE